MLTIRTRGKLPHWEKSRAIYFVTFRFADSLPRTVLQQYEFDRRDIVQTAKAMGRELSGVEISRLRKLFNQQIESRLDEGAGSCLLDNSEAASAVAGTLLHFDPIRYRLFAWCVMPNHVHVVFQPVGEWSLERILHTWKSYSSKEVNRLLGKSGILWQHEYYDHLVRNQKEFGAMVSYVLENPAKAGLPDWQWVGKGTGLK